MKRIKISLVIIIMFLFIININNVNAVEELPDDGGRISSSQVIQTKTGTGPFCIIIKLLCKMINY